MLPASVLAKNALKGGHQLSQANKASEAEGLANVIAQVPGEHAADVMAQHESGKTKRTAIKYGALAVTGLSVAAAVVVGPKLLLDDAIDHATGLFNAAKPKTAGTADVNNLIDSLTLPTEYPLEKATGSAGVKLSSQKYIGSFGIWETDKHTSVEPKTMFTLAVGDDSLKIDSVMVDKQMHLRATLNTYETDENGTLKSSLRYEPSITKLDEDHADDGWLVGGGDAAKRVEAVNNFALASWADKCEPTAQLALDSALANTVKSTVRNAEGLIDSTANLAARQALDAALDLPVVTTYLNKDGFEISAHSVSMPYVPGASKQDLAKALGMDEDKLGLEVSKDCGLEEAAQAQLLELSRDNGTIHLPITHMNRGEG